MQNLSQPFPKPAHALDTNEQENQQTAIYGEKLFAVGDKPPTLAGWPLDWLPVGQLLNGAPLTASVCSS